MKDSAELNKLTEKKFLEYINSKCELIELAKYALSDNFLELDTERRLEIEHILFEVYGQHLPEDTAWQILDKSEILGIVIGKLPNKSWRKVKINIKLWGYQMTIAGIVELPFNARNQYNVGSAIQLRLTDEFGRFDFVNK
jgi:hypothetical protein